MELRKLRALASLTLPLVLNFPAFAITQEASPTQAFMGADCPDNHCPDDGCGDGCDDGCGDEHCGELDSVRAETPCPPDTCPDEGCDDGCGDGASGDASPTAHGDGQCPDDGCDDGCGDGGCSPD